MNERLGDPALSTSTVWQVLSRVVDPEMPFLPLVDLGVIRGVELAHGRIQVTITPTYTGCPANDWIVRLIGEALAEAGIDNADIRTRLSPPWTTDWVSPRGRALLAQHGIVPPLLAHHRRYEQGPVVCPHCGAAEVAPVSEFGTTPCKSLYKCQACREPFEVFKCI